MVIITKSKLIEFYKTEIKAKEPLLLWYNVVLMSNWENFHSVKQTFNSVDSIGNDRYVFNVGEN